MLRLPTESILGRKEKIMAEWIERKISDIGTVVGGATPSTKKPENYDDGKIAWITPKDLSTFSSRYIERGERNITEIGLKSCSTQLLPPNTVLFSSRAPIGYVAIAANEVCTNQGFKSVIPNENTDPLFLFYLLKYNKGKIEGMGSGTTFKEVSGNTMKNILVNVPTDKKVQEKIASILGSIDDKIEENERINNNLLEQALTLYATQFSLLKLNGCIGDYCSVKSGFAFKSSWWTNCGIRVIKIGSINQDNLNLLECSYVDEDKADRAKDFVVKAGDLLIAMTGATIGKYAMVPYSSEVLLVNQRVGKFFLGNNPVEKLPFIYCTLKQPEVYGEVVNRGQGSAQPNISASDIMSIPCVIPSQDAINDFNDMSQPLFDLIISNQRENQQLSELRNALLPKLMSGELDVSGIDL